LHITLFDYFLCIFCTFVLIIVLCDLEFDIIFFLLQFVLILVHCGKSLVVVVFVTITKVGAWHRKHVGECFEIQAYSHKCEVWDNTRKCKIMSSNTFTRFSFWELKIMSCFKTMEQGSRDQTFFKIEPFLNC